MHKINPCQTACLLILLSFMIPIQLNGQTPEEKFFDWTSLQFDKKEYAQRRDKLINQLDQSGSGIYITTARDGFSSGETFRQLNDFLYFTGIEVPNSILCINSESNEVILFVPDRDLRFQNPSRQNDFPGRQLGTDPELANRSGIRNIQSVENFEETFSKWVTSGKSFFINGGRGEIPQFDTNFIYSWTEDQKLIHHIQRNYPSAKVKNAFEQIAPLRMVHSTAEIATLRKAAQITMAGIRKSASTIKPGVDERSLEAVMEAEFKLLGSQRLAFSSIIKSGPNSLWPWRILASHYDRRNRKMESGDLVIFDVGCEYNYYSSDVGRTFPVSGKFNKEQRRVLEMQVSVSDAIISAIKPGATFADLRKVAFAAIPDAEEQYMQVGLFHGHHIGLDTGDPSLSDVPLKAGMIFTVEPWYYNHDKDISVFTEDEVLVTEDGVEVLTKELPRSPYELEKMVNGG